MNKHEKINYVELPAKDLNKAKIFFTEVFNWKFKDYGDEYTSFSNEGLDGGFFKSTTVAKTITGSALLIFYSDDLEATYLKIKNAKGKIVQDIFDFPGGRRFHFEDPNGNEYAVWSDTKNK